MAKSGISHQLKNYNNGSATSMRYFGSIICKLIDVQYNFLDLNYEQFFGTHNTIA